MESDLSEYIDEGYAIVGQCITPRGNIVYTLVKNTEENKIVPVPAPTLEEFDIDFALETLEADWIKNQNKVAKA